jgi:hypothetical protein
LRLSKGKRLKISKSGIIVALITGIIGLFFLLASWEAYSEYRRVNEYTGYAAGHVTKKYFSRAADGNSIYYLDYWFLLPDGNKISSTSNMVQQQWDALKIDDTLGIRYDLSNPNRNISNFSGSISLVYVFFVFLLGTVFLIFGVMRLINSFKTGYNEKS